MRAMGETKSGARVNSLSSRVPGESEGRSVIFKEGKTKKLLEERDSIARWEQLMPGIAPASTHSTTVERTARFSSSICPAAPSSPCCWKSPGAT
jgi:hypothetical protein